MTRKICAIASWMLCRFTPIERSRIMLAAERKQVRKTVGDYVMRFYTSSGELRGQLTIEKGETLSITEGSLLISAPASVVNALRSRAVEGVLRLSDIVEHEYMPNLVVDDIGFRDQDRPLATAYFDKRLANIHHFNEMAFSKGHEIAHQHYFQEKVAA
ncbi:hypothetical protein [Croceicoccus gelatinilyticus]|uniref:hypothetical protein n=1 Tax=Croceicoccus gelatinilyticus TaxID=2835536 RepID=UPI001BD191B4|nr:hypothetical protein [Croceicoccus gelatinilyticus]MBS7671592.1 hypothetical protein [Croceicoccus gelatinilyticus]